jgi:hypothetical protein
MGGGGLYIDPRQSGRVFHLGGMPHNEVTLSGVVIDETIRGKVIFLVYEACKHTPEVEGFMMISRDDR